MAAPGIRRNRRTAHRCVRIAAQGLDALSTAPRAAQDLISSSGLRRQRQRVSADNTRQNRPLAYAPRSGEVNPALKL
jgi:hypothetical protein